jgi:predicted MFS family arabinose efflux permease
MSEKESTRITTGTLATIIYGRTVVNLNFRIVYPFLPAFARGLGIPLEAAGWLVSAQGGIALIAPLFGPLSDRYGRRRIMEAGLLILAVAALLISLSDSYVIALVAFAGFGLTKAIYDPAMLAYIADVVPYQRRGRVMAITELSWSFAWLFGVPLSGFLIERLGWQAPFWLLVLLAAGGTVGTRLLLPPAHHRASSRQARHAPNWVRLIKRKSIAAALFASVGMSFAFENIFIIYGAFLEDNFGLAIGALGLVSVVVGLSELVAEGGAIALTDRIGKRRSVIAGFILFGAVLLVLPALGGNLILTLAGFALAVFFFEYTIVSFIPLASELAPEARATVLSLNVAAMGVGRLVAPVLGTLLYQRTEAILVNSALSAIVCFLSALVVWRLVQEHAPTEAVPVEVRE